MINCDFLPEPHIPGAPVSLCAIGEGYEAICESLEKQDIDILTIPFSDDISKPVSCHPDLHLGVLSRDTVLISAQECELSNSLNKQGFAVKTIPALKPNYPEEAALDFLILKDVLFCNRRAQSSIILQFREFYQKQILVAQGYVKCSTAVVNRNALITSDPSIANAGRNHGFDVLQIRPGYIELPGYDTGFIGGCCGLIAADRMAFSGELSCHPDGNEIKTFLKKHKIDSISLQRGPLHDIGGIIPLKQRC